MRERIEGGEVIGPRMAISSTIVDGPYSVHGQTGAAVVTTEVEARAAVSSAKAQNADFVKVYSLLYPETFATIADEAARQGLPFAGHVPERVSVADASDAGQRSVEHLFGMFTATSSREVEIRRRLASTAVDPANPYVWLQLARSLERVAAATHDHRRAEALFVRLRRNGTCQSPTLTVLRMLSSPLTAFDPEDPRLRYLPESTKDFWRAQLVRGAPSTPEQVEECGRFFEAALRMVGALERAGVGLIAGTDSGNAYCFPGFGVHDELELLVRAGLTPMRALQAATRDAARYHGLEHAVGTVTAGKAADLVVLDADPLHDIRNVRRIHAVVTRGRYLSSADRTRMFSEIETAARQVPTPSAQLAGCGC
jgi:imidazolonepropionase-like amidohydrolase